jgi:DNA-binding CsgD family transcriptional regulator
VRGEIVHVIDGVTEVFKFRSVRNKPRVGEQVLGHLVALSSLGHSLEELRLVVERPVTDLAGWDALVKEANAIARQVKRHHPVDLTLLTSRQRAVLECVIRGLTDKEIGIKFNIETRTVKYHVSGLLAKYGCKNRVALAREMRRAGWDREYLDFTETPQPIAPVNS